VTIETERLLIRPLSTEKSLQSCAIFPIGDRPEAQLPYSPPVMAGSIRVLLVDDESMFVAALRALLEHDARLEVVGAAHNAADALELATEARPDVVLIDISLPGVDGFETTRRLLERRPDLKVIVVSGLSDASAESAALEAGATQFLFKGGLHEEIAEAIVAAAA
jgi:DNA-binding NarL/FixJ family response regulator